MEKCKIENGKMSQNSHQPKTLQNYIYLCQNEGHGNGGFSNDRILQIVDQLIREKLQI